MQVALVSDIHGNLPAFKTVLDDIDEVNHVDDVICGGDVVGYNPWPAECVERVRETCSVVVQGNHDRNVESPDEYLHNEMAHAGLKHAKEQLSEEQNEWLQNLSRRQTIAGGDFLIVHDHPTIQGKYVMPEEFPNLPRFLDDCHEGVVLGHTHVQHEATIDGKLIVNPGSVGQPRDRDPRAAYAILDTDGLTVDLHRVEYDVDRVISRVEALGLPTRTGTRLLDGG